MPDLSIADLLEFEALPEEIQQLAARYFGLEIENRLDYQEGLKDGYNLGYEHGLNQRRRRKAHGKDN